MLHLRTILDAMLVSLRLAPALHPPSFLQVTAIVTSQTNHSAFECWRFLKPLESAGDAGIVGAMTFTLASKPDIVYTVVPPRYDGGVHNAPMKQLVSFLSGVAEIAIPGSPKNETVRVEGGLRGLIIAADTTGFGHATTYPSDAETVALQIPFADGTPPAYEVVRPGPCKDAADHDVAAGKSEL